MNELIEKIQGDPTLMLMSIMAVVVFLVIVLTIIVSAMRVKTYKDRFWNVSIDNKEKAEYITRIERELQEYKIKDAKNQQELAHFMETKATLKSTQENFTTLQKNFHESQKELSQIKAKLESAEQIHENLLSEYHTLNENYDALQERNSKYRTNNARLLMKLESEERYVSSQKERILSHKKKIKEELETLAKKVFDGDAKKFADFSEELMKILKQIDGIPGTFSQTRSKLNEAKENQITQVQQPKEQGSKDE